MRQRLPYCGYWRILAAAAWLLFALGGAFDCSRGRASQAVCPGRLPARVDARHEAGGRNALARRSPTRGALPARQGRQLASGAGVCLGTICRALQAQAPARPAKSATQFQHSSVGDDRFGRGPTHRVGCRLHGGRARERLGSGALAPGQRDVARKGRVRRRRRPRDRLGAGWRRLSGLDSRRTGLHAQNLTAAVGAAGAGRVRVALASERAARRDVLLAVADSVRESRRASFRRQHARFDQVRGRWQISRERRGARGRIRPGLARGRHRGRAVAHGAGSRLLGAGPDRRPQRQLRSEIDRSQLRRRVRSFSRAAAARGRVRADPASRGLARGR